MKLHLGSGTIYLKGYVNVDAAPKYLAKDAPKDLLEQNTTTLSNYYKHDFNKGSGVCIADEALRIENLPYKNETVDEIVMLHVLEHLPVYNVYHVLEEFFRILKPGGTLYLAVPDIKGTAELLAKAETPEEEDWCIRLVHGTQRNEFSHHYCGYTERTLKKLLSDMGFGNFTLLPNKNFYPAIHLNCEKVKDGNQEDR
jgi:predicted SAM-dependent methyltransferase